MSNKRSIRFRKDQEDALEEFRQKSGLPVSRFVQRGLDDLIDRARKEPVFGVKLSQPKASGGRRRKT